MANKNWTRQRLEAKFKQIGPKPAAAIALRAALRVFPVLAKSNRSESDGFLLFWSKEANKHLLAVLRAYDVGLTVLHSGLTDANKSISNAVTEANRAADSNKRTYPAKAAAYAVYATKADDSVTAAADATDYSHYASDGFTADFISALEIDLNQIEYGGIKALFEKKLWLNPPSPTWFALWRQMSQWLKTFDTGSFTHWVGWYQARMAGEPIEVELQLRRLRISEEILSQGVRETNAYLAGLSQAKIRFNRVRALFIGRGDAGKTSLVHALHGETVVEGTEPATPGIDIRDWDVPDTELKSVLWDFGGQVMAHASHQFFLRSSCVYVLVLGARESVSDANTEAEYWLEHVKAFGGSAPVLIVANKADVGPVSLDMTRLKAKYPNIVGGLYPLSCTHYQTDYKNQFDIFRQAFAEQLQIVGKHTAMFTKAQFAVLEKLMERAKQSAFLPEAEYEDICEQEGIDDQSEQNRAWLLDLIDKLGVVLHFPKIVGMKEYVLNPQWLTYGVNALVFAEQARGGRLSLKEVESILCGISQKAEVNYLVYPADKCNFIIDAMANFELAYRLPDGQHIIMPALLPSDTPEHGFTKSADCLVFEYKFESFLPRSVMPNFIVRRHEQIKNELVWELGVYLHDETTDSDALVEVDYQNRTLILWVQGVRANTYLKQLLGDVDLILGRLSLDYAGYVWLAKKCLVGGAGAYRGGADENFIGKARFKDLLALEQSGQSHYICGDGHFELSCILGVMPAADRRDYAQKAGIIHQNYINYGSAVYGDQAKTEIGSFNQINLIGRELDQGIADLVTQLKLSALPAPEKEQTLGQLRTVRDEVEIAQDAQAEPARRKEAIETVKGFAKQVGEGAGSVSSVLKKMQDGEKRIQWLVDKGAEFGQFLSNLPI